MGGQLSKRGVASTVRTFLAVELPPSLKAELERLRSDFGDRGSLKWSASSLLHITVRFLGNVHESRMPDVEAAARAAAARVEPFHLSLSRFGAFPNERAPRVIWVGLARDAGYEELHRLFERAEGELTARGFPPEERSFSPHITLARARDTAGQSDKREIGEDLRRAQSRRPPAGGWQVHALVVMRSDLGREGPRYTPLAACPLGVGSIESGVGNQ